MPLMVCELRQQPRNVPADMYGTIGAMAPQSQIAARPDFPNVSIKYKSGAQPVDSRNVFLAAVKIFKRVAVEDKDAVVSMNWGFRVEDLELTFATFPGRPRVLFWKELSEAAMAMVQFMRMSGSFKELKVSVLRDGAVIAIAELNAGGTDLIDI